MGASTVSQPYGSPRTVTGIALHYKLVALSDYCIYDLRDFIQILVEILFLLFQPIFYDSVQ
jgi:hypothetical protein